MMLKIFKRRDKNAAKPYTKVAEENGDAYIDWGKNWNKIEEKYRLSDDDMFKLFSIPALDDAVKEGKTIRFYDDPELFEDTSFWKEYMYLRTKYGYKKIWREGYWYAE